MQPKEYTEEIDFQKYWLVLKRRWLPATGVFAAVVAFAAWYALRQEPVYQAQGRLLFKSDRTSSLVGLRNESGQLVPIDSQNSPLDTQAEIAQSLPIAEEVVEQLDLKDESGEPIEARSIANGLDVSSVTGTDLLQISYQDYDPERAAAIVNTVMDVFIKNNIQTNRAEAIAAREFITEQLPEVEAAVRAAEADLSAFKERNRVIVLQEEASQAVTTISNLDNTITQVQAQLEDVTARSDQLRRQVGMSSAEAINVGALSQSAGVQEALTQLQAVQAELAVERTRYQPTHFSVVALQRRADALESLLDQRIGEVLEQQQQSVSRGDLQTGSIEQALISQLVATEIERLGLIQRINLLSTAQSTFEDRASVLPELEKTQRELERKVQAAQTTYETLLTRLQEVQVTENQNVGNARVIEAAIVPTSSVAPDSNLQIAAGGFVGLLLAIATAFLLDLTDRSVKTIKEGKELLGFTLLGVIPLFDKTGKPGKKDADHSAPRIIARDMPNSPVREAYQMLQANLKFLRSDRELKTIVVTSSVAEEGKSEVSANLAAAIAQLGRSVLLIDADMRSPSQHHAWELTNSTGLSNVIVGQSNFRDAIKTGIPHLHILPAGVTPPNPVALLDSERMAALIEHFSSKYDFVVIDTPPIAGSADALILGRMTDGILLVMRPGVVDSASANAAKNLLAQSGQHVLGIVANGIDVRSEPDSYFYYTQDYVKGQHLDQPKNLTPDEAELTL
jgi:succinoglycan biosynthesis transport protein ExoP